VENLAIDNDIAEALRTQRMLKEVRGPPALFTGEIYFSVSIMAGNSPKVPLPSPERWLVAKRGTG
jgi:hypothetical protein